MQFEDISRNQTAGQQQPPSAAPLLKGKAPRDEGSCFARNKKKIIIIGSVSLVLIIVTSVALALLLPQLGGSTRKAPPRSMTTPKPTTTSSTHSDHQHHSPEPQEHEEQHVHDHDHEEPESDDVSPVEEDNSESTHHSPAAPADFKPNPVLLPFVGSWELESHENFDEFLKAIGVGWFSRSLAASAKSELNITIAGPDSITVVTEGLRSNTATIRFGEEIEDKTPDGRNVVVVNTLDGSKWVQKERWFDDDYVEREAVYVREITPENLLIATVTTGDVVCIRRYKKMWKRL